MPFLSRNHTEPESSLASWDNLLCAFRKASKGKRGNPEVAAFEYRLEEHLLQLKREIEDGSYRPGRHYNFYIHEPKRRLISAAPFRDRVVHHALCNLIEQRFERLFVPESFANRVGKGTHRALDRVQILSRRFPFVLQCDIKAFFPSIDHEILRAELFARVIEWDARRLIDLILESGAQVHAGANTYELFPGDDLFDCLRPKGLPIGNLTSQFWANVYLNPLDQYIKRQLRCRGYVRYVDDFLLFAEDKQDLWRWKGEVVDRLALLRLHIHPGAAPRPVSEGIPFLGFVVSPNRRRLKRRKVVHYRRRLCSLVTRHNCGEITRDEVDASVQGWVNHARYGNTIGLRKRLFTDTLCILRLSKGESGL